LIWLPLGIFQYLTQWVTPIPYLVIRRCGEILESVNPVEDKRYEATWYIDDIISDILDGFQELELSDLDPLAYNDAKNIRQFYDRLMSYKMSHPGKKEPKRSEYEIFAFKSQDGKPVVLSEDTLRYIRQQGGHIVTVGNQKLALFKKDPDNRNSTRFL